MVLPHFADTAVQEMTLLTTGLGLLSSLWHLWHRHPVKELRLFIWKIVSEETYTYLAVELDLGCGDGGGGSPRSRLGGKLTLALLWV